jgi:hypothetical protein
VTLAEVVSVMTSSYDRHVRKLDFALCDDLPARRRWFVAKELFLVPSILILASIDAVYLIKRLLRVASVKQDRVVQ